MKSVVPLKSWMMDDNVDSIFQALSGNARFVGGCVRDAILDRPIKDIDIATPFVPEKTIELLKKKNIKVIPTGIKHGTVTAIIGNSNFEITTLRKDIACDGRYAEVEFTDSWQEDAARRDFTINAMSCTQKGELYDYFGGLNDLYAKIVRFVGDAEVRCEEDILRILRFFRFNAYYGETPLDISGLFACAKLSNQISTLSGERIQSEMLKLLSAPNFVEILSEMQKCSVLQEVIPFIPKMNKLNVIEELEKKASILPNPLLRIACMAVSADAKTDKLSSLWKLSGKDKKYLKDLTSGKFNFSVDDESLSFLKIIRKTSKEFFLDLLFLHIVQKNDKSDKLSEAYKEIRKNVENMIVPEFPVSGQDLLDMGINSGPALGKALQKAEEWWQDNAYQASKNEIISYIKKQKIS